MSKRLPATPRGRGTGSLPDNRFAEQSREAFDDGWGDAEPPATVIPTELFEDHARSVISYNSSPDVPYGRSVNPYRGCEHGCIYCYARPSHAYYGLSPGLDFETRIGFKPNAPALLRHELGARSYRCAPLMIGVNTDAYQPVERRLGITRQLLAILAETRHPAVIVTKSALVERDLDLLADLAADGLVEVNLSITTLDASLSRRLEPRAAAPLRRLETVRRLSSAGIPVNILVAPIIPFLNDDAIEAILEAAHAAGARAARCILLRLPREVEGLFEEWLAEHFPERAGRILARLRDSHGGKLYDSRFGQRMRGSGAYADLIHQRFLIAARRLGFGELPPLSCDHFRPPRDPANPQFDLFS